MEIKVALSLPRDAASVPMTRQLLDSCLDTLGVTPDTRADIALALSEACANVIQHAGPGREYEVMARTRDGRCIIEVLDTGAGGAPGVTLPSAAVALSPEGVNCHLGDLCNLDDNLPPRCSLGSARSFVAHPAGDGRDTAIAGCLTRESS